MEREIQARPKPERNPETTRNHRREVLWQITIPMIFVSLIILALMVMVPLMSVFSISRWADISVIWLAIPTLLALLVFFVLVGGITYGVIWAINKLPPLAFQALKYFRQANSIVRKGSDAAVKPFIRVQELQASWRAFWKR